ncbi:hypothetical protein QQF64_036058 [Cirrhinus molitorella]|uniref:Uncharacterized protein n=1 Tax=Cirrhinus molitorella TaxID=172907 RepID=A0ABR3NHH7_9TELE
MAELRVGGLWAKIIILELPLPWIHEVPDPPWPLGSPTPPWLPELPYLPWRSSFTSSYSCPAPRVPAPLPGVVITAQEEPSGRGSTVTDQTVPSSSHHSTHLAPDNAHLHPMSTPINSLIKPHIKAHTSESFTVRSRELYVDSTLGILILSELLPTCDTYHLSPSSLIPSVSSSILQSRCVFPVSPGLHSPFPRASCYVKKTAWNKHEIQAVEKHMMRFIKDRKVPGKADCMRCKEVEPLALKNREWSTLKFYIKNRISALNRKDQTY